MRMRTHICTHTHKRTHMHPCTWCAQVCDAGESGCADGSGPAEPTHGKVRLARGLDSEKLKAALSGVADYKNLEFSSMDGAFGNFTNAADWSRFAQRLRSYASIWCCIHAHPGHIHYGG